MFPQAIGLYVHIPFCVQKCAYCDFLSFPADSTTQQRYVDALCREIRMAARICAAQASDPASHAENGNPGPEGLPRIRSIFFGGGTPSVLPAEQITQILSEIRSGFTIEEGAEITIEANPGTVDLEKLSTYRIQGINRISFGCQSFRENELHLLGRIHTPEEIRESVRFAREAGFTNLNLDLISALPGQSLESWEENLRQAIALSPEHISAYSLILEEGTPLYEKLQCMRAAEKEKKTSCGGPTSEHISLSVIPQLPDEDTERAMADRTTEILREAGYAQYEISNYAKPGYACYHNVGYWTGIPYIGFGLGAASFLPCSLAEHLLAGRRVLPREGLETNDSLDYPVEDEQTGTEEELFPRMGERPQEAWARFNNTGDLARYLAEGPGAEDVQILHTRDLESEAMILGLRMTCGVLESDFRARFGEGPEEVFGEVIEKYAATGLLKRENGRIFLSPRGLAVSNRILADFL